MELLEPRVVLTTFLVMNTDDAGPGSLRQAILDSNAQAGPDVIRFSPEAQGTIDLTSGQLEINDNVRILGHGTDRLTVSGINDSRVFVVNGVNVAISNLTIADGLATDLPVELPEEPTFAAGAGLLNLGGSVDLDHIEVTGNRTAGAALGIGAGVANLFGGTMNVTHSQFSDNFAFGIAIGAGGAIINDAGATLTVNRSSFSDNGTTSALGTDPENPFVGFGLGGAITNVASSARVYRSQFTNNVATGADGADGTDGAADGRPGGGSGGAAIYNSSITLLGMPTRSSLHVDRSTFTGNVAIAGNGGNGAAGGNGGLSGPVTGGAIMNFVDGQATILNSRFQGNQVLGGNGGSGGSGGDGGPTEATLGGAVSILGSDVRIVSSTFTQNTTIAGNGGAGGERIDGGMGGNGGNGSIAEGGAVFVGNAIFAPILPANATIIRSTFVDNTAIGGDGGPPGPLGGLGGNGGAGRGGAILVGAVGMSDPVSGPVSATITGSEMTGNVAQGGIGAAGGSGFGGAIANVDPILGGDDLSTLRLRGNRISQNLAFGGFGFVDDGTGVGGGVYNDEISNMSQRDIDLVFANAADECDDVFSNGQCQM